jgi:polyhydroxyalkanoate synthesis repressor PhaR
MTTIEGPETGPEEAAPASQPVIVKKYANRRLYNTESSSYITLDNLADMVRAGRDFVVYDARTGDDITRGVLTQIIVEEESKGHALLPTTFLRQLIGFYGGSLGGVVPRYLEHTMTAIQRQQDQMREAVTQTMGTLLPPGLEEMRRQNMAMMERAMSLFTPFYRPLATEEQHTGPTEVEMEHSQIMALQQEVDSLREKLAAREAELINAGAPSPGLARPRRKPDAQVG